MIFATFFHYLFFFFFFVQKFHENLPTQSQDNDVTLKGGSYRRKFQGG